MAIKKSIAKILCLFCLLLVAGCVAQPAVKVEVLPDYEALFDNSKGWTGADGAYSLTFSDDLILWLFGDTWMGDIQSGGHVNATIVNNTVAIQNGLSPSKASVDFFFGRKPDGKPGAFIRPLDGWGWFWIYHGVFTPQGLYLILVQIERTEESPGFGFDIIGTWLGHVVNPEDPPDNWQIAQHRIPWGNLSSSANIFFGSWILKQGPWLYIYGTTEDVVDGFHHKYMILARVAEDRLSEFDQWRFYGDGNWSADFTKAERLCGGMANEFSVSFLPSTGKFIVVYNENGSSRNIAARFAPQPWGPWSPTVDLYLCPEMSWSKDILCYAAKGHPELSIKPDELIVTYIANSTDFYKMAADARLYRPRFIRVRFTGAGYQ
jgi:Domain of unknown function (DUF4185)